MSLTIHSYLEGVHNGTLNPKHIAQNCLEHIEKINPEYNALLRTNTEVLDQDFEALKSKPLAGLPLLIKDNILIKGHISSCGSKMLKDYVAPYSASCIEKLEAAGAVFLGQTNMDEFAMGGANETSFFGPCKNPHGENRISGGSSWGSAVAVAADMAIAALGTDTGGSVRQPASMCGIVGFKPSYGAISRYGVVAMASSLDQVGIFTKTVEDSQILFSFLAGKDEKDATSSEKSEAIKGEKPIEGKMKFFVPEEALDDGVDPQVKALFEKKLEALRNQGHEIAIQPFPLLKQSLAIYYTLMPSEVSTNLSRFDGIRFGEQAKTHDFASLNEYYTKMRSEGFWAEVKRRILLGTFILSSANYESYYLKALKAQKALKSAFEKLFEEYDAILTPTSPEAARKIGTKSNDPLKMYLADLYTVPANLAELPALSVPMGIVEEKWETLPVGIQIMGKRRDDQKVLEIGKLLEEKK